MGEAVKLDSISFAYGKQPVVRDVSFTVPNGSFLTLLGPSGCGKTTLLKLIGGYLQHQQGRILLRDRDITELSPESRNIGMVFQNYALFPHLTARQNVAFGLEVRRMEKTAKNNRVKEVLDLVRLAEADRDRVPSQLSGGQQQRVALARALAFNPDILLLDEPLANLDRHLRESLRDELRRIHRESGTTTIMVTHDQEEALAASDLIGVIKNGKLLQIGTPQEIYNQPRTPFVASFLGQANILDGRYIGFEEGSRILIRPEKIGLGGPILGKIIAISFHGSVSFLQLQCDHFPLLLQIAMNQNIAVGQSLTVDIHRDDCWEIPERDENS